MNIFRDSKWSPIELMLSPTTIGQIIHLIEKQVHQELIHRVYAKDNGPTTYENYKAAVIVADYFGTTVQGRCQRSSRILSERSWNFCFKKEAHNFEVKFERVVEK